jgi:fumarylacetoacetase
MSTIRLKSFVEGADASGFSLENLPYGVFTHAGLSKAHIGMAISDQVLDLTLLEKQGLLNFGQKKPWFTHSSLNHFAKQGREAAKKVRQKVQALLSIDNSELQNNKALLQEVLISVKNITLKRPFRIGGFTDFYACEQHAINVGCLFRSRENALMPNWKYLPVAYNGRASTVYLSGHPVPRPKGQILLPDQEAPIYTACRKLDFELEMGWFVGKGNPAGKPITIAKAPEHIFGLVVLNDWSARDIQSFEYQPLGPFLSKSFATSISPWVVTLDALEPFMTNIPQPEIPVVSYLQESHRQQPKIQLKIEIQPKNSSTRSTICETSYQSLYWTIEQMMAHHTVNHCILQTGDLLGTGTISGPERQNFGSLLEMSENGKTPLVLSDGQERKFLEDGDKVIMTAYCENDQYRLNFGEVVGEIVSAT